MVSDDLRDVDAGGMVGEDKGKPIADAGGKRRGEGRSAGDGSDRIEGPVDNGAGESSVEKECGRVPSTGFHGPCTVATPGTGSQCYEWCTDANDPWNLGALEEMLLMTQRYVE
eukprot:g25467.t1